MKNGHIHTQTAAVDVPQALGIQWWRSEAVLPTVGATHFALTCWALIFYTATIVCLSRSIYLSWCSKMAAMQLLMTIIEVGMAVSQAAPTAQIIAQALPKLLAAWLLPTSGKQRSVRQQLIMQQQIGTRRVLRPRPVKVKMY